MYFLHSYYRKTFFCHWFDQTANCFPFTMQIWCHCDHITWLSFLRTPSWFSTLPFFLGGIWLVWNNLPHNHVCGFGLSASWTTWTHLLAANYVAQFPLQFLRLHLKALLSSHWGTVTSLILGFGIRIWTCFKALIPWWTMEVYGAIQVLPGSPCSTQVWIFAYKG